MRDEAMIVQAMVDLDLDGDGEGLMVVLLAPPSASGGDDGASDQADVEAPETTVSPGPSARFTIAAE